ncbi:transporter substrate-binding domain-containing protein [Corynebacterium sp. zg254]|uniref:ABC transporter substrate-binding protein n=1 Tax=Corynebacterium zhongnanshanii TaxID=2768834 RepID=A0ABQ6VD22_9CORY|nr:MULTISPECIES: ABC transporter substrate-binding protein [Corynebacterium]KAB1551228.1 ABC transporter substrate-binding protein [Corynebacterium sp. 321]KAB3520767.1 ABC transporter substrate-binding protein [Corynebacterium zhongnanshanii]MCR5914383.1 transporter substrate-binding domain-containing protein [Corynebacterium sp. zg254]
MVNRYSRAAGAGLLACAMALTLGACVTNEEQGNPEGWVRIAPEPVPELAALVPDKIRKQGKIIVGTNPPYAPNEFKDSSGQIIGFEMDLIRAAGSILDLDVDVRQTDFTLILPGISAGTINVGASAFTDTEERQKVYDFVDFVSAGIAWATQPGNEGAVDPDNPCGLTVAVQQGTYSDTDEVQSKSDECVAHGKPAIKKMVYPTADAAATATILKRAQAFSSDSPVISYAVKRSDDRLVQVGKAFDTAPFGWAVNKDDPLGPALAAALQHMMNTGDYDKIMAPWGLEEAKIDAVTFNAQPFTSPVSTAPQTSRRTHSPRRKKTRP